MGAIGMVLVQVVNVARFRHRAVRPEDRYYTLLVLAVVTLGAYVPLLHSHFYLRNRTWLLPVLRTLLLAVPSIRRAGVGTSLLLEQPARPGWRGAVSDLVTVSAGDKVLLPATQGLISILPPHTAVPFYITAMLLTWPGRASGYCGTQIMTSPLTRARVVRLASLLDALSDPLVLIADAEADAAAAEFPAAAAAAAAAAAPRSEEELCLAALGWWHLALGLLLPLLISARHHPSALWRPPPRGGGGGGASAGAGTEPRRKRWWARQQPRLQRLLDRADDAVASLLALSPAHPAAKALVLWWVLGCFWGLSGALARPR